MKRSPWIILCFLLYLSCSETEEPQIQEIRLTVDKEVALSNLDTVRIQVDVLDGSSQRVENAAVEYLVNGQPLGSNEFIPTERGIYTIIAQFDGIVSNEVQVEVLDLQEDAESLSLAYDGYSFLTTNDWSLTGDFAVQVDVGGRSVEVDESGFTLIINDQPVPAISRIHFDEAGQYLIRVETPSLSSNTLTVTVREEKSYPLQTIPVVFHNYGVDLLSGDLQKLIDTLNASFNRQVFTREEVIAGDLNPNAVDLFLRFELAARDPDGFSLASPGLQNIPSPDNEFPELTLNLFQSLEETYGWDPEAYVNIWLANSYGFEFPEVNPSDEGQGSDARGLVNAPLLEFGEMDGLLSLEFPNPRIPVNNPEEISQHILLRSISVLTEHPDYIVNRMGYYLGLFDTFEYPCNRLGDFAPDTFVPDLSQGIGPFSLVASCEGPVFRMNNHMSINRNYRCFTYDQRERVQFVLENGWARP